MNEIEWRFLVRKLPGIPDIKGIPMRQGYLSSGEPSIRIRLFHEQAELTIKARIPDPHSSGPSMREEFTYPVPLDEAERLYEISAAKLSKTRYVLESGIELDVFGDRHEGLVLAELEIAEASTDEPQPPEGWGWENISHAGIWTNQSLAFRGLPEDFIPCQIGK